MAAPFTFDLYIMCLRTFLERKLGQLEIISPFEQVFPRNCKAFGSTVCPATLLLTAAWRWATMSGCLDIISFLRGSKGMGSPRLDLTDVSQILLFTVKIHLRVKQVCLKEMMTGHPSDQVIGFVNTFANFSRAFT